MLWEAQHALEVEKVSPAVCSIEAHRPATLCMCQSRHAIPPDGELLRHQHAAGGLCAVMAGMVL